MCDTCETDYENLAKQCAESIADLENILDLNIVDKHGNKISHNDKLHCKFGLMDGLSCDAIFKVIVDPFDGLELQFVKLANDEPMNQTWFNLSVKYNGLSRRYNEQYKSQQLIITEKQGYNKSNNHRWIEHQESYDIEIFKGEI